MHARFIAIAATVLVSTSAFAAEPAKPAPPRPAQPETTVPKVVLASADVAQTPTPTDQQAQSPQKRRVGRVTSCRCGDQQAQPDDE